MMKQCERLGVSPKWTKLRVVLERSKIINPNYEYDTLKEINDYVTHADLLANYQPLPNSRNATTYSFEGLGRYSTEDCLIQALQSQPWLVDLAKWNLYYQVGVKQKLFWHYQYRIIWPNHPDGGLKSYTTQYAANMMAVTSLLGWKDAVIQQGYMTIAALNRAYQSALDYEEKHRRAQAFMLRLFCDWVGDVSHQWPSYAYDEPIYENLLAHWRTPNPDDLVPCLLAACDRHTHQTGRESSKNHYDFSTPALMRVPIEILFLFRLREWEGLTNPTLDHPLMVAPFDKLPPEQPVPPLDDLMQAVLKRAREDWPNYDEVLALDNLKNNI
jgi:hypothetical protein